MQAIALTPGTTDVHLTERAEPKIAAPDEIKLRVLEVGICGTDREEAAGFRGTPAPGEKDLVLGHEMFGQVVEVGPKVSSVKPGDYAVFTVRRGCGHCDPCAMNHSDMCYTGDYVERGIKERDGYQTERVVDTEQYVVKIPNAIKHIGVLAEPTSVAEKAISEAVRIQISRLPDATDPSRWLEGRQVLVAGLGPIGLLAAFALRLRGAQVIGLDVVDDGTIRPKLLEQIGGRYVDGRKVEPDKLDDRFGHIDLIFEATGVAGLQFNLLAALGTNGVYVLTGIPGGDRPVSLDGAELVRHLVLYNQVMIGSVNANREHFRLAIDDLERMHHTWPDAIRKVITHRLPHDQFDAALHQHAANEIKTVIKWDSAEK